MSRASTYFPLERKATMSPGPHPTEPVKNGAMDQKSSSKVDKTTYQKLSDAVYFHNGIKLENLAGNIIVLMLTELKKEMKTGSRGVINKFLQSESTEHSADTCRMDDCLRWHLLLKLVNLRRNQEWNKENRVALIKMIVKHNPYLPFENPYEGAKDSLYWTQCKSYMMHKSSEGEKKSENHRTSEETDETPFRLAADHGFSAAVTAMISHGRTFYESRPTVQTKLRTKFFDTDNDRYLPFVKILQQYKVQQGQIVTALLLSARRTQDPLKDSTKPDNEEYKKASINDSVKTVEILLNQEGITRISAKLLDPTFECAIKEGLSKVVEEFLKRTDLIETFVSKPYVHMALDQLAASEERMYSEEDRKSRLQILHDMVSKATQSDTLDIKVVEEMITADLIDIWRAAPKEIRKLKHKDPLLHLAVWHQNLEFVKEFLEEYKESVTRKSQLPEDTAPRYPLWYNNNPRKLLPGDKHPQKDAKMLIRSYIVDKMIHEVAQIETLTDIFHDSDVVGDLCFDMSSFEPVSYTMDEFVDSLISQSKQQNLLSYEKTLRYAEFPSLDFPAERRELFSEGGQLKGEHKEVFKILEWLKGAGVETIIKLKVPDRLVNPHDDEIMARLVDELHVKKLDWKVLDLSISVLKNDTKDRIEELSLYSSGNRAAIDHWFNPGGIDSLKNVGIIRIFVIQETCTKARQESMIRYIRKRRDELKARYAPETGKKPSNTVGDTPKVKEGPEFIVTGMPWYAGPKLPDLRQIAQRLSPKLARLLLQLKSQFGTMDRVRTRYPNYKPIRVAVLDSGVLSISPISQHGAGKMAEFDDNLDAAKRRFDGKSGNPADSLDSEQTGDSNSLWSRIVTGRSFVDGDSKLSPWLFASNPHGTQMANLICAIDPYCELYVARVAEDTMGIRAKKVAQAIEWAMKMKVDVISMSFIIGEYSSDLQKRITEANEVGIVLSCSAHDEGSRIITAYPAAFHTTAESNTMLRFAACDEYGKILREDKKEDFEFLIRGHNVSAGLVPFLKSEENITGSSVATAIGAGLSSLILTAQKLGALKKGIQETEGKQRYKLVHDLLNKMASGHDRFIPLDAYEDIRKLWVTDQ